MSVLTDTERASLGHAIDAAASEDERVRRENYAAIAGSLNGIRRNRSQYSAGDGRPIRYACPKCGAPVARVCRTESGAMSAEFHVARIALVAKEANDG